MSRVRPAGGGRAVTSLICTHCARAAHLSCRQPSCQCPCRQQLPPVLHEVSGDVEEAS
jgi:hypothetical protein